jgi:hypothetical protein
MTRVIRLLAAVALSVACRAGAQGTTPANAVRVNLDYAGAEELIAALKRGDRSDADVDSLLRVPGVRAMVDNVTRFVPPTGVTEFRKAIKEFARTQRRTSSNRFFELTNVWDRREQTLLLIRQLRSREATLARDALARLDRYRLNTGPLDITAYFVAGGVSDGFVFDDNPRPEFYINLTRSNGDLDAVVDNIVHEAFHVMQKAAQRRVPGLAVFADSSEAQPPPLRLLTVTLAEGTANVVVDPLRSTSTGASVEQFRQRYRRNAKPARIVENFALFDRVLSDLRSGRLSWNEAYRQGFTGDHDARFYFVGYEMAKAIERHCGVTCIGRLFEKPPIEFFRQYIALYKRHSDVAPRFSSETERFITSPQ